MLEESSRVLVTNAERLDIVLLAVIPVVEEIKTKDLLHQQHLSQELQIQEEVGILLIQEEVGPPPIHRDMYLL
jgi:hypothetical protein